MIYLQLGAYHSILNLFIFMGYLDTAIFIKFIRFFSFWVLHVEPHIFLLFA